MAEKLCMGCMEKINDKYDICPYCDYKEGTPAKEAYHMPPGSILQGRYIVGKSIGYGGFGVTYIGYDPVFECKIAIKEYLPGEFATRCTGSNEVTVYSGEREEQFVGGIMKFGEEARRLAKFKNIPGIVRINDSFNENNTAYIVMEYLEGETLKEKLEREEKLSIDEALNIIMPILDALKEVHKEGILHRDISPDNIFITKQGGVKLIDFGAARYATTTHSKSLSVIVKPGYAPQEQYRSRGDQGTWTDVYACAATLYKMITGITPEDSMERGNKDTLKKPSKLGIKIPKNKENALMNALNLRIEDRTKTAEEFAEELSTENSVKLTKVHLKKMDVGRWPIWLKIASGAAAASILIFVGLLVTGVISFEIFGGHRRVLKENHILVPNVINKELEEAKTTIGDDLIIQVTDKQNSDEIAKDTIKSQGIPFGEEVEKGSVLELVISAGRETVFMPDLEGLSQEEVIAMLDELELTYEIIEEESDMAPGFIFKQEIEADSEVEKGTKVMIYLSKGKDIDENKMTTVPNVVGKTFKEGNSAMSAANLYIYISRQEYSTNIPKGQIISQDVKAGTEVNQGSKIGVVVSLGIETSRVPDVQYKSVDEARALISSAGLNVNVEYQDNDDVAKDHVISQSVAAGTEVEKGKSITIYVSNGRKDLPITTERTTTTERITEAVVTNTTERISESAPASESKTTTSATTTETSNTYVDTKVEVPNLIGQTKDGAVNSLQAAGLGIGSITEKEDESKTNGTVLSQSVSAGTRVEKGTTVNITVCKNKEKPKTVSVPNLVGKTESNARSTLTSSGLAVGSVTYKHDESKAGGTVISQGTSSGTSVNEGTAVNIVVCNNETYTEYRYKSVTSYSETTTTTNSSPGSEYTYVKEETNTTYGAWGNWSGWTESAVASSDTRDVRTETGYMLGRWKNGYDWNCYNFGASTETYFRAVSEITRTYEYDYKLSNIGATGEVYYIDAYGGGRTQPFFHNVKYSDGSGAWGVTTTMYSYRDRSKTETTTYYWKKPIWSSWSSWSITPVNKSDTVDVETRQVYKY